MVIATEILIEDMHGEQIFEVGIVDYSKVTSAIPYILNKSYTALALGGDNIVINKTLSQVATILGHFKTT